MSEISVPSTFIKIVGLLFIGAGVISAFVFGTLTVETPGLTEGFTYEDPHPLRGVFAMAALGSGLFFGLVLVGIGQILDRFNDIDDVIDKHTVRIRNSIEQSM